MTGPGVSSRTPFWSRRGPYASVRVCLAVMAAQAVLLVPLVLISFAAAVALADAGVMMAEVIIILWMCTPLGAAYGIYLALWDEASEDSWRARMAGMMCNAAYLMSGLGFAAAFIGAAGQ